MRWTDRNAKCVIAKFQVRDKAQENDNSRSTSSVLVLIACG